MHISNLRKTETRSYVGVHCSRCHTPILFAVDRGDGDQPQMSFAKLVLTCAGCGHKADYSNATLSRFRK